ncbi:gustatory receptor for bitter taste 66a-like [Haematobia irritans]|uniref:gustatory receptor for bitter taste 66a-like n=1 Tax=Haematobia irritans TaxID=7368 RepID=UPI003F50545B
MAYKKTETFNQTGQRRQLLPRPILEQFSLLFYIGKCFGIISQDFGEFRKYKHLEKSLTGTCLVIVIMVYVFISYNLMVWLFYDPEYSMEKDNFTVAMGLFLTFFSIFMYMTDRVNYLRKEDKFIEVFDTLQDIDDEFMDLGIEVNNGFLYYRILIQIVVATLCESLICIFTFAFLVNHESWLNLIWIFTAIPTHCNALDKIWFSSLMMVIKYRFELVNEEFNMLAQNLQNDVKEKQSNMAIFKLEKGKKSNQQSWKSKIQPTDIIQVSPKVNYNQELGHLKTTSKPNISHSPLMPQLSIEMVENRCEKLCQLHSELCSMGEDINGVWSLPNLAFMAYGFVMITAQLYFYYCAYANQTIPSLFRSANSLALTIIYLFYVSAKCITILMMSWLTSLECKKTGICIHRCATSADREEIYEMVNHLSLKLFNHAVEFNACAYFTLNMDTLSGFCGAVSSYLIILIQFNIEQQQVKSAVTNGDGTQVLKDNGTFVNLLAQNFTAMISQIFTEGIN